MNIQKFIPLITAVVVALGMASSTVNAAIDTSNLMVYKFKETKPATIDTTRSYMKRFLPRDYIGEIEKTDSQILHYVSEKDVNTTFEHNLNTGDISFYRNFSRYIGDFVPKLPQGKESVRFAYEFLKENRLMPVNPRELKVAHIGGLRSNAVLKGGKRGPIIDKLKTITFSRQLNELPVIGAGSKLIVNVGDEGEIIGVTKRWRELSEPVRLNPKELISEREALGRAKRQILSEFGRNSEIEFEDIQVAYFDNNKRVIQPVFAFQVRVTLEDKNLEPLNYISIIPVMANPIEELNLTHVDDRALELIQGEGPTIPEESRKDSD